MVTITTPINILDANITYTLMNDIVMTGPFTSVGANVIFDGNGHTITINNVPGFTGLFSTAVTVNNLGILSSGTTTLADNAGWFFKTGTSSTPMGGIATNCYSTGDINGQMCGGIFGRYSSGRAENCYSTGKIGNGNGSYGYYGAGGIFGGDSTINAVAKGCYSIGDQVITYYGNGGIFGPRCKGNATNCYSTGIIAGTPSGSGGIFGYYSPIGAFATNCYSTGAIGTFGGGIFGESCTGQAKNCYTTGSITNSNNHIYGVGGGGADGGRLGNTCGYSVGWINASANQYLTGYPGDVQINANYPQVWFESIAGKRYTLSPITTMSIYPTSFTIVTDHGTRQLLINSVAEWYDIATWSSSDTTIATVSASGIVTAIANGTTTITATLQNLSTTSICTIGIQATGVTIDPVINYMAYAATLQLHASVLPISAIYTIIWSSSDTTIATIDNNGLLQAQSKSGTTIITATSSFNNTLTDIKRIIVSADGLVHTYIIPIIDTTPLDLSSPDTIYQLTKNIEYTQSITVSAPHITFDGNGHTITINNVSSFTGLFSTAVTVNNLGILSSGTTTLADGAGWFFKTGTSSTPMGGIATNCYSTGDINGQNSGGIFGKFASGRAENCYSIGKIGKVSATNGSGGIFGGDSTINAVAKGCYSIGDQVITYYGNGGIFGPRCKGNATNCYSTGIIADATGGSGGIFGYTSTGIATNCYSTGAINGLSSGGIFGASCTGQATNCYTTGFTSSDRYIYGGGGGGLINGRLGKMCGYSTLWGDTSANKYLLHYPGDLSNNAIHPQVWYSSIAGKRYTLSPITTMSIYPTSFTIVTDHGTQQLNTISAEWSDIATWSSSNPTIATVSASGIVTAIASGTTTITATLQNLSTISSCTISIPATGITIDSVIHYMAYAATLQLHASVLPISAIHTTFTWSSSDTTIATIDNSGLLQAQSKSGTTIITATSSFNNTLTDIKLIIVSADGSVRTYIIPIIDTTPLDLSSPDTIYQLTKNIEYTQSITVSAPHITFDGNGHTITINNVNGFTGLFSTVVTVNNLGITTSGYTTLADNAGWFFANGIGGSAKNCYSTGDINGQMCGGIFGRYSSGRAENCYSTGKIGNGNGSYDYYGAGGIFGGDSTINAVAKGCYSIGDQVISYWGNGGIFGPQCKGNATNCYSTGIIAGTPGGSGGIFGYYSLIGAFATNCYSTGQIGNQGGGIFGRSFSGKAINCYSTGAIGRNGDEIFGYYSSGTATNSGHTDGWFNDSANLYLTGDPADTTPPRIWLVNPGYNTNDIRPYIILLPPTAESPQIFASGKTVANLVATGTAIKWYNALTGGTVLATTYQLTSGTYYASQTIDGGESSRTSVLVIVTPPPIVQSVQTFATRQPIVNVANKNPINSSYGSDTITANASGIAISSSVTTFYNEMNTVPHRVNVKPIFSSYRDYMLYLQNRM